MTDSEKAEHRACQRGMKDALKLFLNFLSKRK